MSEKFPVYREPIAEYEVMSNQSKTRKYKVCFGKVDWGKNGKTELAVYHRVLLKSNGAWIPQNYSAHILVTPGEDGKSDFDLIMEKMNQLKQDYL